MKSGLLFLAVAITWGQPAAAPAWREFSIGPPTRSQAGFSREGIRAEGVPLKRVLARAYGLSEQRILAPPWVNEERYAMTALVNNPDDLGPLLQQELVRYFHLAAHRENRDVPVFVLRTIEGTALPPAVSETRSTAFSNQSVKVNNSKVKDFADALGAATQRPVFDETGIEDRLDFNLSWKPGDVASLQSSVRNQLGMQLVEEKRALEILVVDRIEMAHFNK